MSRSRLAFVRGQWTFASPDGIDFHPISSGPVYHGSDTQDVALWDQRLNGGKGKYVAFRRLHQPQSRACETCAGRAVRENGGGPEYLNAGCAYQHNNSCPPPSSPLKCKTTADCNPNKDPDPTCDGVRLSCLPSGQCGAAGKGPGGLACMEYRAHTGPGWCGLGAAAERFVGRCETDTLAEIPGCDEGKPKAETKYTTVFGPDDDDSPCVDIYTNQVVVYEGQYLAFPGACEFIVSTENLVCIAESRLCTQTSISPSRRRGPLAMTAGTTRGFCTRRTERRAGRACPRHFCCAIIA